MDKDFLIVVKGKRCGRCHFYQKPRLDIIGEQESCILVAVGDLWGVDFEVKYGKFDINEKGVTKDDVCLVHVGYMSREARERMKGEFKKRFDGDGLRGVFKAVAEARKELKLPIPSSHTHKGKGNSFTSFRDEDLEEYKTKLEKWFGDEE